MSTFDDHYEFRDQLAQRIVRDLVGPGPNDAVADDERILDEPPRNRYIAGILYAPSPRQTDTIDPVEDNDTTDARFMGAEQPEEDKPVAMANRHYPAALATTFAVDSTRCSAVEIEVHAARYAPTTSTDDSGESREAWTRNPIRHTHRFSLDASNHKKEWDGLELDVRIRAADDEGLVSITAALVNRLEVRRGEWRDQYSFFQTTLSARTPEADAIADRSLIRPPGVDADAQSFALTYRHAPVFAAGHGCGVEWTSGAEGYASEVRTTAAPTPDLLLSDNNPDVTSEWFSMRALAHGGRSEVVAGLRQFVAGYGNWISERSEELDGLDEPHLSTGRRHLADCELAASRIHHGIDFLETDDLAWTAFQLANKAMLAQRARSDWQRGGCQGNPNLDTDEHQWRAFQLGFILMTLESTANPDSTERDVADLLWFPTGGGKTEAYLGLIAFMVFLRRLRAHRERRSGAGLTVIMRYTLRLLTLQQFQRAAMLMCACEAIRRERDDLGREEISICLWVGQGATPTTLADTRTALTELSKGKILDEKNPVQLTACPWCATPLSHRNYWVADNNQRLVIACRNPDCQFKQGLPCYVVDEDVYVRKPTLMIATVDKFASLPWREEIGDLFAADDPERLPPELIIQDELHLISGPLGTIVGLYEAAVHMLCSDGGVGPKVIASTATIRRAAEQIRALYAGGSFQFPPPGLDARDSYFAVEASRETKGTRRYLGLLTGGTSQATLMIRAYAAAMQGANDLPGADEVRDAYWTMLGYFNSLRVLGGARLQVADDVQDRMRVIAENPDSARLLSDDRLVEMTSRIPSSDIPRNLDRMAEDVSSQDCVDVVLATNMISVGVDVDRLGLMAVMGQPQSASEYIQATSRVGRRHPGLVLVLFNAARSRDRSHYEDFVGFHNAIYRQVDASSVTPFAARARDRALHAVLVGLMRAKYPKFRPNAAARNVADLERRTAPIVASILERVAAVDPDEVDGTRESLTAFVKQWKRRGQEEPKLVYRNHHEPALALLSDAARPDLVADYNSQATMWSMRAVDTESHLYLVGS